MSTNSGKSASSPAFTQTLGHIPDDLMNNILLRLPVKHLLRCRCVSKPWCSLIDSDKFVKKHLRRTIECSSNVGIVCKGRADGESFYLANVDSSSDSTAVEIDDPLKSFLSGTVIVGGCNGLVCLWKNDYKINNDIYLWNPATRKARRVPKPPAHIPFPALLVGSALVGFGYDNVNDDYKVMTTVDSQIWGIMVAVYSLKSNSWTRAETITNEFEIRGFGRYANGSLYWLAVRDSHMIFAFDLEIERHKELPFPAGVDKTDENAMDLTCLNDCLRLIDHHFDSRTDLWLMKNNGVESSWFKFLSVEQAGLFGSCNCFWPVVVSKTQDDVLLEVDDKLRWYAHAKNEFKNVNFDGFPVKFDVLAYTESLVRPTPDSKLDGKQQRKDKMRDFLADGFKLVL